jgi:hypothetical protein
MGIGPCPMAHQEAIGCFPPGGYMRPLLGFGARWVVLQAWRSFADMPQPCLRGEMRVSPDAARGSWANALSAFGGGSGCACSARAPHLAACPVSPCTARARSCMNIPRLCATVCGGEVCAATLCRVTVRVRGGRHAGTGTQTTHIGAATCASASTASSNLLCKALIRKALPVV